MERKETKVYKVARAVILAAGMGIRMRPVTDSLPKPLVLVNGIRIIDTLLDALLAAGITEIYIVRGYLGEKFEVLKEKYPMLRFLDNPEYAVANNIMSVICAGNRIKNAYILEADLLLNRPELITPYQYESNYLAIPVQKTEDWCFFSDMDKRILKMALGGENCHQMVGISYWTEQDASRLMIHAQKVYDSLGGKEKYWDQVALEAYLPEYDIYVRECRAGDVVEIDTLEELQKLDASYEVYREVSR